MIERYEAIEDRIGRVFSFAQLLFAAHRDDPKVGQFYQGVQERVTAIGTRLLFVTLELNKLDDEALAARLGGLVAAGALPTLARLGPQLPPAPALRRGRADAAREARHRPQRLGAAVRRDHGGLALPARRQGAHQRRDLRPDVVEGPRAARAGRGCDQRRAGAERPAVQPGHEHAGQGQADRGRVAQVRAPDLLAQPRQPGRGRGGRGADPGRARLLPADLAPLLRAQGALARPRAAGVLGPQRAPARGCRHAPALGGRQGGGARRLSQLLADAGRDRRPLLPGLLDRRPATAGQGQRRLLPSRPCRAPIPTS